MTDYCFCKYSSDGLSGLFAGTHGQDNGCSARNGIAAGIYTGHIRSTRLFVGNDIAALSGRQFRRALMDQRVGGSADRNDDGLNIQHMFAALDSNGGGGGRTHQARPVPYPRLQDQ